MKDNIFSYNRVEDDEKAMVCFLQAVLGISNGDIRKLRDHYGGTRLLKETGKSVKSELKGRVSDKALILIDEAARKGVFESGSFRETYDDLSHAGIGYYIEGEEDYPVRLTDIGSRPLSLWVRGRLPDDNIPSVAIIGARNCSGYGRQMAREWAREIAGAGVQIISGMAYGIDSIAETAALDAGGSSYAVLGNGVNVCYPKENASLYDRTIVAGGIISEYPPDTTPRPQFFPARNRIISGFADAVIVIEARERSGTLITVNMALNQGRDVYALPGRVTDSLSYGCNRLIREGAVPLIRPHEFLQEFMEQYAVNNSDPKDDSGHINEKTKKNRIHNTLDRKKDGSEGFLTAKEKMIMKVMDYEPKSISEIYYELTECGDISEGGNGTVTIELTELMAVLSDMTIRHKISCVDGMNYFKG
ncbi:MAG: DNA-processing protein DprA [Lachnospiraceae bacterium]|nr:DNA-processing protein DprA [Lachnospiraceae bacterium]